MAARTNSEKIDELEKTTTVLTVNADAALAAIVKLTTEHAGTARLVVELRHEFALLRQAIEKDAALARSEQDKSASLVKGEQDRELASLKRELEELKKWKDDLKKHQEERSRRLWAFGPNAIGAVISVLLAALVAFLVSVFRGTSP